MKVLLVFVLVTAAYGGEKKPLPNQAGNDDVELAGTIILERAEVREALGADLGPGYVTVRMKVTPKTDMALRVSPDDFTLLSRKNGERSPALLPTQIVGKGGLVLKPAAEQPGGDGTRTNGPIWGGVTPRFGGGGGAAPGKGGKEAAPNTNAPQDSTTEETALLAALQGKIFPETETKMPAEGLLYFVLDGKLKPKDVSLIYKGPAGKLVMDFK